MKIARCGRRPRIEAPASTVFSWHARPGAFERLTPPWEPVAVVARTGRIADGARVTLQVRMGPFAHRWILAHHDSNESQQFCEVQIEGPLPIGHTRIGSSRLVLWPVIWRSRLPMPYHGEEWAECSEARLYDRS
jgi:hypothetical protein